MNIRMDPDGVDAAAAVSRRQHQHVQQVRSYVDGSCSQLGAFTGVMDLFQGSYESALASAREGLDTSLKIAEKMDRALKRAADELRDADREVYEMAKRLWVELGGLGSDYPKYQEPGSGDSTPGGPTRDPLQPEKGEEKKEKDPKDKWDYAADQAKKTGSGALGSGAKPNTDDLPWWTNPKDALKNELKDTYTSMTNREEYLEWRRQGLSHDDAMDRVKHTVDDDVALRERKTDLADRSEARQTAYDNTYDAAREQGASQAEASEDARRAGSEASRTANERLSDEHAARDRVGGAGADAYNTYDQAKKALDNVNKAGEHLGDIHDNLEDAERYEDYEDKKQDDSAEDWANS